MKDNVVNFYFFRTEAEAICSALITNNKKDEANYLISYKQQAFDTAKYFCSSRNIYLFHLKASNYIARTREIKEQINFVKSRIPSLNTQIKLHISNCGTNTGYIIDALIRENRKVAINLFPHGLSEEGFKKLSFSKIIRLKIKKYGRIIFGISFYDVFSDIKGYTSPLIEKIYIFPGFENKVETYHKLVEIVPTNNHPKPPSIIKNRMLVIGQRTIDCHLHNQDIDNIINKIIELSKNYNMDGVDYVVHPRAKRKWFLFHHTFNQVSSNRSAEILALSEGYRVVVSFSSTSLLFIRLLNPDEKLTVLSVGLNKVRFPDKFILIKKLMKLAGVKLINID